MAFFQENHDYSPDTILSITAAVVLGVIASISFIIQPGLVGGFVEILNLSDADAGELAATEMFGIAAATILLSVASLKVNWRMAVCFFILTACIGNIYSASVSVFSDLMPARFIAGFGHGGLISLSFAAVGLTSKTDRNLGIYLVALLSYGAVGLLFMPDLLASVGLKGIFLFFTAAAAAGLLLVPHLPASAKAEDATAPSAVNDGKNTGAGTGKSSTGTIKWRLLLPTLIGFFCYNISQGIVWAYLFLIGLSAGIEEQTVANALFISQIFGVIGALLAVIISAKIYGRFGPLTIGILGGAACIAILIPGFSYVVFLISVCGFNLAWNKVLPFILAAISDFDARGRIMPFALAIQMLGLAVGPYIASQIVGDGDYTTVEMASVAFFLAGYVLIIIPVMSHKRLLATA